MESVSTAERKQPAMLLDVLIRAGLIIVLAYSCYRIFSPFLDLMIWSVILAITLYPLHLMLRPRLGNKDGRTATVIVVIAIAILLVPILLLGKSLASSLSHALIMVKSGTFHIPPPADAVASWPVIGKPLHAFWLQAATDLTSAGQKIAPQLRGLGLTMLGSIAGFGAGLVMFIFALVIAGIFMAFGEGARHSAIEIAIRIFGPQKGAKMAVLCTATIRAVALGVVGIAFVQMLLIGTGFALKGIPGAGLLALAVLLLGIVQIPATLVTLPVIIFVFATEGASAVTIGFAVYTFVAGLVDNVLKPLVLGRGVDVPMPVVLIGALGGMVVNGTIGLFMGPVLLAVGYELFWQWVKMPAEGA